MGQRQPDKILGRAKWKSLVAWAVPALLKGLLLRSADRASVWWHPLTAFSITMALSHPCPSSLSQLNEPFPRQIKTGESAFTRGRRLRKAIQTGMEGGRAAVSAAKGQEEKGKAGTGERGAGSTRGGELHLPSVRNLAAGKGSHRAERRDQRHAGDERKMGKVEADREVTLVPAAAQPAGAARCASAE